MVRMTNSVYSIGSLHVQVNVFTMVRMTNSVYSTGSLHVQVNVFK